MKWVHMARCELILRLGGALWLTIISQTPLTPRRAIKIQNRAFFFSRGGHHQSGTVCQWTVNQCTCQCLREHMLAHAQNMRALHAASCCDRAHRLRCVFRCPQSLRCLILASCPQNNMWQRAATGHHAIWHTMGRPYANFL